MLRQQRDILQQTTATATATVLVTANSNIRAYLPLSMRQTERSLPVSAHSCLIRIAAANPAGPPPTISTSKGMASRGSSSSVSEVEKKACRCDCRGLVQRPAPPRDATDIVLGRNRRLAVVTRLRVLHMIMLVNWKLSREALYGCTTTLNGSNRCLRARSMLV